MVFANCSSILVRYSYTFLMAVHPVAIQNNITTAATTVAMMGMISGKQKVLL